MKKLYLAAALSVAAIFSACASDDKGGTITVNFAVAPGVETITVRHADIDNLLKAKTDADVSFKTETVKVENFKAIVPLDDTGNCNYIITLSENPADGAIQFFTSPGDTLTVAVESINPLVYSVTGSPLMDGITMIDSRLVPIQEEAALVQNGILPQTRMQELATRYNDILVEYIRQNPVSPAAAYALLSLPLPGDSFDTAMAMVQPEAKKSVLWPYVEQRAVELRQQQEQEQRQHNLASGTADAPDFTLKNLDGKDVSLKDFRGKYVVLDFWGSWCGWCIKGMPAMKEAYSKYKGKLEIIGVDCGDTPEQWRDAVTKHQLPWINVYNPRESNLTEQYAVQGFPTKVIVSPEGKIVDIVTGEDPAFYTKLANLLK